MKYLTDSSALNRIQCRQVDPVWHDLVGKGLLSVCEPVLAEALLVADTKDYAKRSRLLRAPLSL